MPDLVLIRCPTLDFLVVEVQILNQYRRMKIDTEHVFILEGKNGMNAVADCNSVAGLLEFSVVSLRWQYIFMLDQMDLFNIHYLGYLRNLFWNFEFCFAGPQASVVSYYWCGIKRPQPNF